jgi:taurine dioxygenase
MSPRFETKGPLPGAAFGGTARLHDGGQGAAAVVAAAEAAPDELAALLAEAKGLLLVQGLNDIADDPQLLIRFSRLFGPEVEDYRHNLTDLKAVHVSVPEILLVSNMPPVSKAPPKRPEPPLAADGLIPVQYPHRKGWHTDQSYRRPPPDISLFYAVTPATRDTGQTLFANGILAYEALPPHLKAKVDGLQGLHAQPGSGRGREAALAGRPPRAFALHERSQPQPVVRTHPVTGERALYLCEWGQMDWFEGPFVGMEPGPHGAGAALLDEIMAPPDRAALLLCP